MIIPMESKFDKYWMNTYDVHYIVSILDSWYKILLLTHIFKYKMHLSSTETEDKLDLLNKDS